MIELDILNNLPSATVSFNSTVNQCLIPVTQLEMDDEGASTFNAIYNYIYNLKGWHNIVRTNSGGISTSQKNFRLPMWDVRATSSCLEMTIIDSKAWRIQFRTGINATGEIEENKIYGRQAFTEFKKMLLEEYGVDLSLYEIPNGPEVKETIEKAYIKFEHPIYQDMVMQKMHHIDFHNSYPAGLANTHPEFRECIEHLYENRKERPINKAILNLSIGFMQSLGCCGARWAQLSRDAIADNNRRIEDLAQRLRDSGRAPVLYNTDGIWYYGEIYHGEGEGTHLGEWSNDHTNCKFRAKSQGCYEFIEDGKYYPVVRGRTRLDRVKPRTEWSWGDIYQPEANETILWAFVEGEGVRAYNGWTQSNL